MHRRDFLRSSAALAAAASVGRAAPTTEKATVTGTTAFACDLYGKLRSQPGNLFLSPLSIATALTMTSAGAAGTTLDEMTKVLHLPDQSTAHAGAADLAKSLTAGAAAGGYELRIANALWTQQGYPLKDDFLATMKKYYAAAPERADFAGDPEAARRAINAWVERQTNDKIKELFPEGIIDGDTRLVLANAVYFLGDWKHPFNASRTVDRPFRAADGPVNVPTMTQTSIFRYAEGDGWQVLRLPYKSGSLEMVVVLPRAADGLGKLEAALTPEALTTYLGRSSGQEVAVSLPKFKAAAEFNLSKTLAALGMAKAFSPSDADFSRMTSANRLFIGAVVHKAYVDVNEKGSEAAAATGVEMRFLSAQPATPKEFKADRPFLVMIRDAASGAVLFLGRVAKP